MDFTYTPEQQMLRESLARYLDDRQSFADRQSAIRSKEGWDPSLWLGLAQDLGVLGAAFDLDSGGLGGGAVENMIVMEEVGRALVIAPYLETVVIGGGLLRRWASPRARELIQQVIAGQVRIAFAQLEPSTRFELAHVETRARRTDGAWRLHGLKDTVRDTQCATHFLVTARISGEPRDRTGVVTFLVARNAQGVTVREYPTVDGTRAGDVRFDGAIAELVGDPQRGYEFLEAAVDEGIAALCAEAGGIMRRLLADTLEYTRQRRQFDAPIAANQVLQHRMVDMYMAVEQTVSMTCFATLSLDGPEPQRVRAVSAAKAFVGKAGRFVGQSAIQLHGGIGMTDELAVSHYFKRLTVIESQLGSADHHAARLER